MKGKMRRIVDILGDERGYIDLGIGSMVIQVLIAGVIGAFFVGKIYLKRIISKVMPFRNKFRNKSGDKDKKPS